MVLWANVVWYFGKLFKGYFRYIENCEYNQAMVVWVYPSLLTEDDVFNLWLWFVKRTDM